MPAGVSWTVYIRFCTAAAFSTFLGSQVVHNIYRPLDDLDKLVQDELERIRKEKISERNRNISLEKDKYRN